MRTPTLPRDVHEEPNAWITVSDGTVLAARIWRPATSDADPVPGILEYLPYRKDDLTSWRDSIHHPYLAAHGYACVRVDIRGTGASGGVLVDEYTEDEHRDGEEILAWIAEQPWCNGTLGMMGISWGGFNSLQIAARRPPNLKAIAISSFTDDRYGDDMHYMGGCLLSDNLAEAGTMFSHATMPPDPEIVGDGWRERWCERLEGSGPWIDEWLGHQRRDLYWQRASVCEDYSAIDVPVLASSGWADGYSNAVTRLLAHLDVPRRGLIGPWSHKFAHLGEPGPAIGYLQELVAWWDHWLKGLDNGVEHGPLLRVWMQESVPPSTAYEDRPGRWVAVDEWPAPEIRLRDQLLDHHHLVAPDRAVTEDRLTVCSPLSVGQYAGKWASYNAPPDLPYDQREEDGGSLVFDSAVLDEPVEILGAPTVDIEFSVDRPVAMVAVRLSDVWPDGRATRVTYGLLNLTHRDDHTSPSVLEPGRRYRTTVTLNGVAQQFPAGHRIRLSVSTCYWPLAWPSPQPVMLSLYTGTSSLRLPVFDEYARQTESPFQEPEGATPISVEQIQQPEHSWVVARDLANYDNSLRIVKDNGLVRIGAPGIDVAKRVEETYGWKADDHTSVFGDTRWSVTFSRDDWSATTVTHTRLTCSEDEFRMHAELDAYEGDERIMSRIWTKVIPRDHV
ncbi:CocE/NonD family hydrolase [Rhodococcus sp. NPDC058521]|uniref:CocE/NonD family hydrolase n=1 Tax=Rhodococcus sp. NPDC058521 TaxID=3346536 RepID=UPI00364D31F0